MDLSFDKIVDAWQQREFLSLLLAIRQKLSSLFPMDAADVVEHINNLFNGFDDQFRLRSTMHSLIPILTNGGTPFIIRGLAITEVVTVDQAAKLLSSRSGQEAYRLYRRAFRLPRDGSHTSLRADFFEGILRPVLDLAEYRFRRLLPPDTKGPIKGIAAKTVRAMVLLECWDKTQDERNPLMRAAQELRKVGALPLWIGASGETTVLIASP